MPHEALLQYGPEFTHDEVDLLLGDHQRRCEPKGLPVGVLHEDAAVEEIQAHVLGGADHRINVDARPQTRTPDRGHAVADEGGEPGVQTLAQSLLSVLMGFGM